MGRRVNAAPGSFAVALTACTTPAAGRPGFDLPEDEIEVGVGIHGEPGRSREKLASAKEIVGTAIDAILPTKPLTVGDQTIVMVNGLGGTPLIELYLLFSEVAAALTEPGSNRPQPCRQLRHQPRHGRCVHHRLPGRRRDAVSVGRTGKNTRAALGRLNRTANDHSPRRPVWTPLTRTWVGPSPRHAEQKDHLTQLDSAIGDADHGVNMKRGFSAVTAALGRHEPRPSGTCWSRPAPP